MECPSRLKGISVKPWTSEERTDNMPAIENRMHQTIEGDIFSFTSNNKSADESVKVKGIGNKGVIIKVQLSESSPVEDTTWCAKVRVEQEWKTIDAKPKV